MPLQNHTSTLFELALSFLGRYLVRLAKTQPDMGIYSGYIRFYMYNNNQNRVLYEGLVQARLVILYGHCQLHCQDYSSDT